LSCFGSLGFDWGGFFFRGLLIWTTFAHVSAGVRLQALWFLSVFFLLSLVAMLGLCCLPIVLLSTRVELMGKGATRPSFASILSFSCVCTHAKGLYFPESRFDMSVSVLDCLCVQAGLSLVLQCAGQRKTLNVLGLLLHTYVHRTRPLLPFT
jgi:hypothetical protein